MTLCCSKYLPTKARMVAATHISRQSKAARHVGGRSAWRSGTCEHPSQDFWFHAVNQSLVNRARVKIVGPRKISVFYISRELGDFSGPSSLCSSLFDGLTWTSAPIRLITQWDILPQKHSFCLFVTYSK